MPMRIVQVFNMKKNKPLSTQEIFSAYAEKMAQIRKKRIGLLSQMEKKLSKKKQLDILKKISEL